MISTEIKQNIVEAMKKKASKYPSYIRFAFALEISNSQLSRIMNGETEKVISEGRWMAIARKLNVPLRDEVAFNTAKTPVFNFIWQQLEFVQQHSVAGMLCDRPDIGKSHTAKAYAREKSNVVYIDCGTCKTGQRFVRALSKAFGLDHKGRFDYVRSDLIFYINSIETPLVILDEFGDLCLPAYLEFKTIWNQTDRSCAWYAMGADGLQKKIERHIANKIIGFAEIFSRMGNRFQRITPLDNTNFEKFQQKQIAQIGKANSCMDAQQLIAKSDLSLRRIPIQLGLEKKLREQEKKESNQ